ncbi:MAG TPA: hypothetical protein VIF09_10185, partial [Polyangiaceae bacterium]
LGDDRAEEREVILKAMERALPEYGASDHPAFRPNILSARASIAATRGKLDEARAIVQRLADAPERDEGWATWVCARWVLGSLRGGIEGEAQVQAAQVELASRGVTKDRRVVLVLFPGFARYV